MKNLTCENCKQPFTLSDEDLTLYAKFNVPNERFCSNCRMQQLMMWRNERTLHARKDMNGKPVITIYPPEAEANVLDQKDWWKDDWDALKYGREYDFSKPFFVQFQELLTSVPLINVFNENSENSDYTNHVEANKNSYLIFASMWSEDAAYGKGLSKVKDSMDILHGESIENCYDVMYCEKSYNVFYSERATGCNDSYFLYNCKNCSNCTGCVNLKNKSYCFFNEQLTKEEYEKRLQELHLENRDGREKFEQEFQGFLLKFPRQYAYILNSEDVSGDYIFHSKSCHHCFSIYENGENLRYITHGGWQLKDSTDCYGVGLGERLYKVLDGGIDSSLIKCMMVERGGFETEYGFYCHNSSYIFGCVGVRKKEYCILNKQYTKEEYEALLPRIKKHMNEMPYVDKSGRTYKYGDFFPSEISFYCYNDTIAQEYFPLTREQALAQGYRWRDSRKVSYENTLRASSLPKTIAEVQDDITKQIITCEHEGKCADQCTTAFKIMPFELAFYRKHNIPLPKLCSNCRHFTRIAKRNPMKLWHRTCMCNNKVFANTTTHWHKDGACTNEFETSYAPERPEIVYCRDCFNSEVA